MTDDDRCGAIWHDQLNPAAPTYRCTHDAGHHGPHRHHNGTTWGGPADWGIS